MSFYASITKLQLEILKKTLEDGYNDIAYAGQEIEEHIWQNSGFKGNTAGGLSVPDVKVYCSIQERI